MLNKDNGGLGVGSIRCANISLLGKWRWRFLNEKDALWRKVINVFYGEYGGFDTINGLGLKKGVWKGIVSKCYRLPWHLLCYILC